MEITPAGVFICLKKKSYNLREVEKMRLWHKDLIPYLPRQQLLAQWRECCAISKVIAKKGTPNHILVNKIVDYPPVHFIEYAKLIVSEFMKRGYKTSEKSMNNFINNFRYFGNPDELIIGRVTQRVIFPDWHNERYLKQCLFNLQEKYDCGGIPENEWKKIEEKFGEFLK